MKELTNYLKVRIIESTNLEILEVEKIRKVHNIIIKYLDKTIERILENLSQLENIRDNIINEICYNSNILVDYNKFSYVLVDYLNAYYA